MIRNNRVTFLGSFDDRLLRSLIDFGGIFTLGEFGNAYLSQENIIQVLGDNQVRYKDLEELNKLLHKYNISKVYDLESKTLLDKRVYYNECNKSIFIEFETDYKKLRDYTSYHSYRGNLNDRLNTARRVARKISSCLDNI